MPKSWVGDFLTAIHLDIDESLFRRSINDMVSMIESSDWVRKVKFVERNFKGDLALSLDIRKPICVLKNKTKQFYMDDEANLLSPLTYKNIDQLADGHVLPKVYVEKIVGDEPHLRNKWQLEVALFVKEWFANPGLSDRLQLNEIRMEPYRSKQVVESRLNIVAQDLQFKREVEIEWGVHRDYNELEDRTSDEKVE